MGASGGYSSDNDDGDGDAEKALVAAAGAVVMPGGGAPENGFTSSAAVTPHPWLVTDAFHVCLWYVLRYAGPALSAGDLWACRAVLSLTATLSAAATGGGEGTSIGDSCILNAEVVEGRGTGYREGVRAEEETILPRLRTSTSLVSPTHAEQPVPTAADGWSWAGTEESELLLRLALRKPHGFTARHLELRYGDWLHVQPALDALTEERRFLWWASPIPVSADDPVTELLDTPAEAAETVGDSQAVQEGDASGMAAFPPLERYDGPRVARLLLLQQGGVAGRMPIPDPGVPAELTPPRTPLEELIRVAQAVRATELRVFLSSLRQCSRMRAAREDDEDDKAAGSPGSAVQSGAASRGTVVAPASTTPPAHTNAVAASFSVVPPYERHQPRDGNVRDLVDASATGSRRGGGGVEEAGVHDVIPTRKWDMIRYFVERRYALLGPSSLTTTDKALPSGTAATLNAPSTAEAAVERQGSGGHASRGSASAPPATARRCFPSAAEEMEAVAQCWDRVVGAVYAPHIGLRRHLTSVTELFHVLTSNSGAGAVSEQGAKAMAATMAVAAPPTLLMVRPQLLLLLQTLRAARERQAHGAQPTRIGTAGWSVPHTLLPQWCVVRTATGTAAQPPRPAEESASGDVVDEGDSVGSASFMDGLVCSSRSFRAFDAPMHTARHNAGDEGVVAPHMCLFATPAVLVEYRAALAAQRALYEVGDGAVTVAQRLRGRNPDFVTRMHDTVMAAVRAGVAAVKQHPVHSAPASARFVAAAASAAPWCGSAVQLESLLYRHGCHAGHLLVFTPLYRWFACVELLFPLLQSARRYAEANVCLHYLLYEPVFVLHPAAQRRAGHVVVSPVTFAFRYKIHKRGEWLARLALNLAHQKRHADALALLEEVQAGYRELASHTASSDAPGATAVGAVHMPSSTWLPCDAMTNTTAAALCAVLAGECTAAVAAALPVKVHRRGRMLRVLWPSTTANTTSSAVPERSTTEADATESSTATCAAALQHAAWDYLRDRYCRRHDRLTLERALATAHRRVHQWTPLPAHRELATRRLVDIPVRRVGGVRDALDRMLWREPTGLARPQRRPHSSTAERGGASSSGGAGAASAKTVAATVTAPRQSATQVEVFVLRHYLAQWNTSAAPCVASSAAPQWCGAHCEGQWIACLARALLWDCYWAFPSTQHVTGAVPAAASTDASSVPPLACNDAVGSAEEVLWLSAFQDGPLDVTTPLHFVRRRRALVETRLSQLERCSREELVGYVAARIRAEEPPATLKSESRASRRQHAGDAPREAAGADLEEQRSASSPPPLPPRDCNRGHSVGVQGSAGSAAEHRHPPSHAPSSRMLNASEEGEDAEDAELIASSLPSLCSPPPLTEWADSSSLPLAQGAGDGDGSGAGHTRDEAGKGCGDSPSAPLSGPSAALQMAIPEAWKVSTGSLPLLDVLRVMPLAPLWLLLRCIYLSPLTEGVPLRFSGFPDLIFWRGGRGVETGVGGAAAARAPRESFCLMEVKSPTDVLSTKQVAVNDLLRRCGFDVSVVRVDEVHDDGTYVSTKRIC